jgi:hypothetical protein
MQISLKMKTLLTKTFAVLTLVVMCYAAGYPQTRVKFARGRTSATVRGKLGAKGSAQYVLGAREGQAILATISSTNGKVTITGANGRGSTDYEMIASDGDNYVGIYNSGGATNFTLTISIR